jgi:hypothetical protein
MIRTLYIYWDTTFKNSPEIIKKCLLSWKQKNTNWNIIELDDNNINNYINISEYIPNINKKNISKTALSDIIRIILLKKYGGLWCDATTFCMTSLDNWLDNYIHEGFFAFNKPGPGRLISSWFIYGNKDNYLIDKWFNCTIDYWNNHDEMHTYFWFHYLFNDLYNNDKTLKKKWDNIKKISADGPHYLQNNGILNKITQNVKNHIDNKQTYLYKLTYKYDFAKYNKNCILAYLFNKL